MEQKIYFETESPDFNFGLWGKKERIAVNRVVLCIMTEYGLINDKRMEAWQLGSFIGSLQTTTGRFKETRQRIKPKSTYIKKRRIIGPIKTICPATLGEHAAKCILVGNTS